MHCSYMYKILFDHRCRPIQRKFAKHQKLTRCMHSFMKSSSDSSPVSPHKHRPCGRYALYSNSIILGTLVLICVTNKYHRLLKRRMQLSKSQCQLKKVGTKRKKRASSKAYPLKLSKLTRYIHTNRFSSIMCGLHVLYLYSGSPSSLSSESSESIASESSSDTDSSSSQPSLTPAM